MIYTDWNIMYLSIYLYIYSCYEVVISPAGSRAMIRESWGQASTEIHMHVHYIYTYSLYFLHSGRISTSI